MLSLSNLKSHKTKHSAKRVGRGIGSGRGKTSGRGTKGQRARTGGRNKLKRLGMRRLILSTPKLGGFRSLRQKPAIINVGSLENAAISGSEVTPKILFELGLISSFKEGVKILGEGHLTKKLTVKGCLASHGAREKIIAAGGEIIELLSIKKTSKA